MSQRSPFAGGIRALALFEAGKAGVVLLAGFGILSIMHRDLDKLATRLMEHMHLNPANGYPRIFVDAAKSLSEPRIWMLATMALVYCVVRSVQAYGLWHGRIWAEWFGVITGSIYIPVEVYELSRGATWLNGMALLVNAGIVAFLGFVLYRSNHSPRASQLHTAKK
ncbi:MAG: DUF2127 domain-containing protein [Planctomycetales bacterium]